jgi:phage-related minor tail protein
VVVNALLGQKDKLAAEYAQLPATVSQAFTRLTNAFGQWVTRLDESTGLTKKLAEAMTFLANNLDTVMQWLQRIAEVGLAVLAYRLIPALITAVDLGGGHQHRPAQDGLRRARRLPGRLGDRHLVV